MHLNAKLWSEMKCWAAVSILTSFWDVGWQAKIFIYLFLHFINVKTLSHHSHVKLTGFTFRIFPSVLVGNAQQTSRHYKDLFFRRFAAGFTSQICLNRLLKVTLNWYLMFYTCLNVAFIWKKRQKPRKQTLVRSISSETCWHFKTQQTEAAHDSSVSWAWECLITVLKCAVIAFSMTHGADKRSIHVHSPFFFLLTCSDLGRLRRKKKISDEKRYPLMSLSVDP